MEFNGITQAMQPVTAVVHFEAPESLKVLVAAYRGGVKILSDGVANGIGDGLYLYQLSPLNTTIPETYSFVFTAVNLKIPVSKELRHTVQPRFLSCDCAAQKESVDVK